MSLAWLLTLAGLHFTAVSLLRSETPFEVIINPLDTPVDEGDSVLLDCKANAPLSKCAWSNEVQTVRPGVTPDYDLRGHIENGDCSLLIKRTKFHLDKGRWTCRVTADKTFENKTSNSALLDVYVPPSDVTILTNMPELYYKDQLMLYAGNETAKLLTCQTKGSNPPASVAWLIDWDVIRGNQEVLSNTNNKYTVETSPNLTITTAYHQRNLTCQVTHPTWRNQIRKIKITLIVRHRTTWVYISPPLERTVHLGGTTTLRCNYNGFPIPKIKWFKKNSTSDLWDELEYRSELKLGINISDHGTYRCSAKNFLNQGEPLVSAEATVHVMYATSEVVILSPSYILVPQGETVSLSCSANGFPEPIIRWHKEKAQGLWLTSAIGANFTILNVTVQERGKYRCIAVNTLNSKEIIAPTVVHLEIEGYEALVHGNTSSRMQLSEFIKNMYILIMLIYVLLHL